MLFNTLDSGQHLEIFLVCFFWNFELKRGWKRFFFYISTGGNLIHQQGVFTDSHINHQMVQSLLLLHLTITRAFVTNYKMKHF